ncbi:hypothetical protein Rumeso_04987 [Rubellimicrobium mesophilum DSM 19309]|uniref:Phage protein n=1 Tax=Rubellimicrobium mesophilum DSM 19309 TaxID=442562 RepID=A0A017HB54_9RHOB|nr:HK97-gp10 family putative phage morphogenesis protein [Rubellimicrobium mesophilum]EYD71586.1 hypothetical protein Rumeso_04987 [Rubellimicrobium mesophilum DSM 19309]
MATGTRVQLSGFKELGAQLKRLSTAVARNALQRAGTSAMEPMARLARQLAPKDTEELAESIDVGTVAANDKADVGKYAYHLAKAAGLSNAEAVTEKRNALRAVKGERGNYYADVFMGPVAGREKQDVIKGFVQEFGTLTREPQPYLRPAFEQDKGAMLERLKKEIWFEVSSAIARSEAAKARRAARG